MMRCLVSAQGGFGACRARNWRRRAKPNLTVCFCDPSGQKPQESPHPFSYGALEFRRHGRAFGYVAVYFLPLLVCGGPVITSTKPRSVPNKRCGYKHLYFPYEVSPRSLPPVILLVPGDGSDYFLREFCGRLEKSYRSIFCFSWRRVGPVITPSNHTKIFSEHTVWNHRKLKFRSST